jgi:hypothetical protein
VREVEAVLVARGPRQRKPFDLEADDPISESFVRRMEEPLTLEDVPDEPSRALRRQITLSREQLVQERHVFHAAVNGPIDDVTGGKRLEMLRHRIAYWRRKLEKLQGMSPALLPVVCAQQAMTNSRLTPAHRAILCECMFAHLTIGHMTLNAADLEGRRCLPAQRRTKELQDVLLYGNAMIKRMVTWAFIFVTFIVTDDEAPRVVMIGSMGQEHYHSVFRRLCYGDDCVFNFDGSMMCADLMNWLRA